jgi:hypothetical protein
VGFWIRPLDRLFELLNKWRRNRQALAHLDDLGPGELTVLADCLRRNEQPFECNPQTAASLRHKCLAWRPPPPRPHMIRDYVWKHVQRRKEEILSAADGQERARAERFGPADAVAGY